jgi:hypothetical protein
LQVGYNVFLSFIGTKPVIKAEAEEEEPKEDPNAVKVSGSLEMR